MALSLFSNLSILVSPIFMMQVLDRVIPSGNLFTLGLLLSIAMLAIALQSAIERVRDATLAGVAFWLEAVASGPVLTLPDPARRQEGIDTVRRLSDALKSNVVATALSIPWLPLFFVALAFVHWAFVVLVCAIVSLQLLLRVLSERAAHAARTRLASARREESVSLSLVDHAMKSVGMRVLEQNLVSRHLARQEERLSQEQALAGRQGGVSALGGFMRNATQLLALSAGAGLVAIDQLSAGGMIAASIIVTKLAGMIEQAIRTLPDMRAARDAMTWLAQMPAVPAPSTDLPTLSGHLQCRQIVFPRGKGAPPRLDRVSFALEPGECLAILGASGSGKSTLLNALCGVDPAPIGAVFYDESEIKALSAASLAAHVGVLPQRADLLQGTLAENICSFAQNPNAEQIVAAARLAGVHGLISALPGGYDVPFAQARTLLSAGQQQRVALARAIYHRPRYLFLDEPNALLDAEGERQLCDALARLKQEGTTVVMVVHRSGVLGLADKVLVLDHGKVSDFGPRAEVLARFSVGRRRIELPLNQNSLQDLADWVSAQFTRTGDDALRQKSVLVATELFNMACAEEKEGELRVAQLDFTFLDDHRCEITLSEDGQTLIDGKLAKVESLIRHPHVPMVDLSSDEVALAMVAQVADAFDVRNDAGRAIYFAALSDANPAPPETGRAAH
ncbi:MAG: ATP-binding cassette domain-containing protein [Brevirhabdus sp.]